MLKITIGMKLKSNKTQKTYLIDEINEDNNVIYLNCQNDKDVAENHILSKVIEFIESGYYVAI